MPVDGVPSKLFTFDAVVVSFVTPTSLGYLTGLYLFSTNTDYVNVPKSSYLLVDDLAIFKLALRLCT